MLTTGRTAIAATIAGILVFLGAFGAGRLTRADDSDAHNAPENAEAQLRITGFKQAERLSQLHKNRASASGDTPAENTPPPPAGTSSTRSGGSSAPPPVAQRTPSQTRTIAPPPPPPPPAAAASSSAGRKTIE